ncbi:Nonribosomal peptide synthetase 4, partial [Dinochytrium kinnereticum]
MKWIVIGRYRSGTYPIWGWYHFRWWLVDRIHSSHRAYTSPLRGTQFLTLWYRLLGAKIGQRVHFDTDDVTEFDLVSFDEGSRIGCGTRVSPAIFENGSLILRRVRVGKCSEVGARCTLVAGSTLLPYSTLSPLSTVPYNCTIPAHSHYGGCPLRPVPDGQTQGNRDAFPTPIRETLFHGIVLFSMAIVSGYCLGPSATLIHLMYTRVGLLWAVTVLPALWLLSSIIYAIVAVMVRRISATQMNIHSEVVPLRSREARRSWLNAAVLAGSLLQPFLDHFSGSVVINWFYRALGARIGRNTFIHVSPESLSTLNLLSVGDGAVIVGNGRTTIICETYESGSVRRAPVVIGEGAIVGAGSVLLPGAAVPPHAVVSPRTRLSGGENDMRVASHWIGAPPFLVSDSRPEVIAESIRQRGGRAAENWPWLFVEALGQLIVPLMVFSLPLPTAFSIGLIVNGLIGPWALLYLSPIGYALFALCAIIVVFMGKWSLVGRIRPDTSSKLYGSRFLGLTIFTALQRYATTIVLDRLKGTDFMAGYWRILGAHVGVGSHLETMDILEYDLITIGDSVVVGRDAVLTAVCIDPLRISFSQVVIEDDVSIGSHAVISPGAKIQRGTLVGAGSLVMPGETLSPEQYWEGCPTEGRLVRGLRPSARLDQIVIIDDDEQEDGANRMTSDSVLPLTMRRTSTSRGSEAAAASFRSIPLTQLSKSVTGTGASKTLMSSEMGRASILSPFEGTSTSPKRRAGPQNIFMTGATGFVGCFLLDQLLESGNQ